MWFSADNTFASIERSLSSITPLCESFFATSECELLDRFRMNRCNLGALYIDTSHQPFRTEHKRVDPFV
jgi:hypothetical protein